MNLPYLIVCMTGNTNVVGSRSDEQSAREYADLLANENKDKIYAVYSPVSSSIMETVISYNLKKEEVIK